MTISEKKRCLSCLCWHEPGEHKPKSIPVTLTGQVPVFEVDVVEVPFPVSGNPEVSDDDA